MDERRARAQMKQTHCKIDRKGTVSKSLLTPSPKELSILKRKEKRKENREIIHDLQTCK